MRGSESRDRCSGRCQIRILRTGAALLSILVAASGCANGPTAGELARDSRIARARRDVGVDYLTKGRTPLAIRELRNAYRLDPSDPITSLWLGEAYRRRGLPEEALVHLVEAVELDPASQEARINLAGLYIQLGRHQDGIEHSQILIDDPTFETPWRAYTNRGWAQLQMGLISEARKSFTEALAFHPGYWPATLNLGILEAQVGRSLAAIVNFETVLDRENLGMSIESEATYRLGRAYVSLGRRDRALEYFKRSAERMPLGRWGKQSGEYLKLLD